MSEQDKRTVDEAAPARTDGHSSTGACCASESPDHEHHRLEHARERVHEKREHLHERAEEHVEVRGHDMQRGAIFKIVGLVVVIVVIALACVAIWPLISNIFEPGGVDRLIEEVQNAGPLGVLFLLAIQVLQVVVAFIPGEVVQVAAGMMYGPWIGALVIFVGCLISSAFIFVVVRKLGAPFVQSMVPTKYLEKFRAFERSGKLTPVVFALFLIPGLPKDVFTYLVPLTDMRMRTFVILANVARIPGIVLSTYAADGLLEGRLVESVIIFVIAAAIAVAGIVFSDKIMAFFGRVKGHRHDADGSEGAASCAEESARKN